MLKIKISVGWNMPFQSIQVVTNCLFLILQIQRTIFITIKNFFINSKVEEPDFWFIVENTDSRKVEKVKINRNNIIFLGSETRYEPSYFLLNSKREFLSQFDTIYSPNYLNLKNSINEPAFLNWKLRRRSIWRTV